MKSKEEIIKEVLKRNNFKNLNPVQRKAVEMGILEGENLVVSSPTSSGKTLLAEISGLNCTLNKNQKMIYLCPLVALAREKYEDFKRKYQDLGIKVALSVGNYDSSDPWLETFDWIVTSNEKMDSLIRHGVNWIEKVGLVVADEIHLLNDFERGPTLEILLTLLKEILPNSQILAFSATISNADEIGEWLGASVLKSKFRPVPLYKGIVSDRKIKFPGFKEYELRKDLSLEEAILENTLLMKKQLIFFVSSRRNAEALAERLSRLTFHFLKNEEIKKLEKISKKIENVLETPTEQCKKLAICVKNGTAFYHSGLLFKQRILVEEAYKEGLLKVIASTTALCLHPEILVYCEDGFLKKIKDVKIGEKILIFDFKNFKFKFSKVLNKTKRSLYKNEDLLKIKTSSGKEIIATSGHPFLTLKGTNFSWISGGELKKGDYIAVSREISEPSTKNFSLFDLLPDNARITNQKMIDFLLKKLLKKYGTQKKISQKFKINYKTLESYFNKNVSLPVKYFLKFTRDLKLKPDNLFSTLEVTTWKKQDRIKLPFNLKPLARLFGILLGDGSIIETKSFKRGKTYLISLVSRDIKWLKQYQNLLKVFGIKTKIQTNVRDSSLKHISFKSKILGEIFHKKLNFPLGRKAKRIQITPFFLKSNELLKEVIGGLIDTDGSVGKEIIEISSISKEMMKQLQLLLLRFGVYSFLEKRRKSPTYLVNSKNPSYRISIFGESATIFKKNFNLLHYKKKRRLSLIRKKSSTFSKDIIPNSKEFIKQILNETKISQWKMKKISGLTPYNYLSRGQNLLRRTVLKNFAKLPQSKTLSFLQKLAQSPLAWERIKSIRKMNKRIPVYDISVCEKNFWANGFVVHNSYGINLPNFRAVIRDIKRYSPGLGSVFLPVLEVEQMFGRSGRPQFDFWGEGILIAKRKEDEKELKRVYIHGELEEILSKISSESALRSHLLSLVSNRFCKTQNELISFLKKTFFGQKYDVLFLKEKVKEILETLEDWGFLGSKEIRENGDVIDKKILPTKIGKRISQLYLDPLTAYIFIENLKDCKKASHFTLLCLLSQAQELKPSPSISTKDLVLIEKEILKNKEFFFFQTPDEFDEDYEEFLREAKLATVFSLWIEETSEQEIMEKFKITPGELYSRREILDWLLYSILEISKYFNFSKEIKRMLKKLRARLKYGIKEELIPLVSLEGIGRKRARILFDAGFSNLEKLKKANLEKLARVLKSKILAQKIKKQLRVKNKE